MKQVFNPYLPSYEYIPDGEPHVFGERLYIFGSHDRFGGDKYCLNDYVCWSTPVDDLSAWRCEGIYYKRSKHPTYSGKENMFAPDVACGPDGRYYLYYSIEDSCIISVAVCDSPAGEYEYYGEVVAQDGHALGSAPGDWYQFDPAVLVDDDGRIWLYSGSGQVSEEHNYNIAGAFVMELAADMRTVISEPKIIMPCDWVRNKPNFFEGSSIRKMNGLYYFVYSASDLSGLNYCTSKFPDRDFVYRGRIHSTSDIGIHGWSVENTAYPIGNNHGGIVCVNSKYYIFDHRMTNNTYFSRQGVAEEITISEDGYIEQVESTSCGLNGGPLVGKGKYPAYIACNLMVNQDTKIKKRKELEEKIKENPELVKLIMSGKVPMSHPFITQDGEDREDNPNQHVAGIEDGTIIGYKYFDFKDVTAISIWVRGTATGTLSIRTALTEEECGNISINISSDEWIELESSCCIPFGVHPLYFSYHGEGTFALIDFEIYVKQ
jgi:hypothetical protein